MQSGVDHAGGVGLIGHANDDDINSFLKLYYFR